MDILDFTLLQDAHTRKAKVIAIVDIPVNELSEIAYQIRNGKQYSLFLEPKKKRKSQDQREAIWAKITEIANALGASKEEIYEECLRRYGQGRFFRVIKEDIPDLERDYRVVDIKKDHGDGSVTVLAYRGLSSMDSREAGYLLDGVLSECKEMGLRGEING